MKRSRLIGLGIVLVVVLGVCALLTGAPQRLFGTPAGQFVEGAPGSGHSALYRRPRLGSLAGDQDWLNRLRNHVAGSSFSESGAMAGYRLRSGTLRVLYAGDVEQLFRMVLVEGEWSGPAAGSGPRPMQVWLDGRAGADPDQLSVRTRSDPVQDTSIGLAGDWVTTAGTAAKAGDSAFVVLSRRDLTVLLVRKAAISGAGIRLNTDILGPVRRRNGVFSTSFTASNPEFARLFVDGQLVATRGVPDPPGPPMTITAQQATPQRGGTAWPPAADLAPRPPLLLTDFSSKLAAAASASRRLGTFTLLAAAPPADDSAQTGRSLVGVISYPGGGRALASLGVAAQPGGNPSTWLMAGTVVPSGSLSGRLSFVWIQREGLQDGAITAGVPGWAGAMGPNRTATVTWIHASGSRTTSTALNAIATTRRTDVTGAQFMDDAGRMIGQAEVAPALVSTPAGPLLEPMVRQMGMEPA